MRKTSVYLTDELSARLKRLARSEGRSEAEVLRAALEAYRDLATERRIECVAVADGPGDAINDIPKEQLLRGFGEESLGGS